MRKQLFIFSFLLSAFAVVGWAGTAQAGIDAWVLSDSPGKVAVSVGGVPSGGIALGTYVADRYYAGINLSGVADIMLTAPERAGYRFLGWYGMSTEDAEGTKTTYENCTQLIEASRTISETKINASKKGLFFNCFWPFVCLKYERVVTIETSVSPTTSGSASLTTTDTAYKTDGQIAVGKSCTLSATPETGYAFKWWEHGTDKKTDNPLAFTVAASDAGTFTAVFTQKVYKVTFHDDKNSYDDPSAAYPDVVQTVAYGEAATAPDWWSRTGYSLRWSPEDFSKITGDLTVTAYWKKFEQRRVTLTTAGEKGFSGKITSGQGSFDYGKTSTLQAEGEYGSRFVEWRDTSGKCVSAENPWKITVTQDVEYVAWFELEQYDVTFKYKDANYADTSSTQKVKYRQSADEPEIVKDFPDQNMVFERWDKDFEAITGPLTVNAVYVSTSLKVTFNLNGGSGAAPTPVIVRKGGTYGTLPSASRDGYDFAGWFTQASGGVQITETTEVTKTGEEILYAHWTAKEYTVTFQPQGGTTPKPETKTVTYGDPYGTLASTTRAGYDFRGWFSDSSCSDAQVLTSTRVETSWDHDLFAGWTAKTYWVSLQPMGGSVYPSSFQVTYDSTYASLVDATRTGYTFVGWFTAQDGGDQVRKADRVQITAEQTLYAHWTTNTYTVTFDPNGGEVSEKTRIVTYDQKYGELPEPTCDGAAFQGWFTDKIGGNRVYGTDTVKITEAQTLYAHWAKIKYDILFERNGAESGSTSYQTGIEYGKVIQLNRNGFQRKGHTFRGWNRTATAAEIEFADGASVSNLTKVADQTVCLYAIWRANTYTVTFDSNGGSGTMADMTLTYTVPTNLAACAYQNGVRRFSGWKAPDGTIYKDGASVLNLTETDGGSVKLTAQWREEYLVTFDGNGATSGETADQRFDKNEEKELTANGYLRTGYIFEGWKDKNGVSYTDHQLVKNLGAVGETVTLRAQWTPISYSVEFNPNGGAWRDGCAPTDPPGNIAASYSYDQVWTIWPWADGVAKAEDKLPINGTGKFVGWSPSPTDCTVLYRLGDSVSNLTTVAGQKVMLYAIWDIDYGDLSRALGGDALHLMFVGPDWEPLAKEPDPVSPSSTYVGKMSYAPRQTMEAQVSGSGTLRFQWKCHEDIDGLTVSFDGEDWNFEATADWEAVELKLDVDVGPKTISFATDADSEYPIWIADMTWTPEGGGEPTPGDPVAVTAAGVVNGEFSLTIPTDPGADYGVWTNADLTVDSWGLMGDPQPGKGQPLEFKWTILPGFPQLFFKAHKVEYK